MFCQIKFHRRWIFNHKILANNNLKKTTTYKTQTEKITNFII